MTFTPSAILVSSAAIASAVSGGVYYAFSTFVMRGLNRADPLSAISTMRGMNVEAPANPMFMLLFFGTAVLAFATGIYSLVTFKQPGSVLLLVGAILAFAPLVVTAGFNVPLNDGLVALDPATMSADQATAEWAKYFNAWMPWNHVRALTGIAGAALLFLGWRAR